MSAPDGPGPEPDELRELAEVLGASAPGVRVFWIKAPSMQGLVERLALTLSEQMANGDELHVTYNSMQAGWETHPAQPGGLLRKARPEWTELHMEYSAFVVLRAR